MRGCIYHLGNPSLRDRSAGGCFTAYELLSWESAPERRLLFRPELAPDVFELLACLPDASPHKQVVWTSDYQFGLARAAWHARCPWHACRRSTTSRSCG